MATLQAQMASKPAHLFLLFTGGSFLLGYLGQTFGVAGTAASGLALAACLVLFPFLSLSSRVRTRRRAAVRPRPAGQQHRANRIVERIAHHLGVPVGGESLPSVAEAPLSFAWYDGWLIEVFLDGPTNAWVLILSKKGRKAFRSFEGDETKAAADYVCQFAKDLAHRHHGLRRESLPGEAPYGRTCSSPQFGAA